ncbi:MAG: DUF3874 domain-containing protein [Prevotella sp.]|nr:DUF3874 domain-containing protein [Prevotella sp.]
MEKSVLMAVETPGVSQQGTLAIELFLMENYRFRRNILNGKVEFATLPKAAQTAGGNTVGLSGCLSCASSEADLEFRTLTPAALNSIVIRAKREEVLEKGSPKSEIKDYVESEEVPEFNPIQVFLDGLPVWDGQNHIARVFSRIPGISSEQLNYLTVWLRSAVAHWMQMDMLHGNECVPTLIGQQGCGKTVFVRRLLPPHLREYFLGHLNLANKFDKEMALTNNLLVNLDELDAIRHSQQASLKQALSVNKVNSRPIFGRTQEDRPRFASFVATTNNRHPLQDSTGSRRYICIRIPDGQLIDNTGEIDYGQLYAQVVYELQELKAPYWFNNEEVARIQQLNQEYMEQKDIAEIVEICFRKPKEGETAKAMSSSMLLNLIKKEYPSIEVNHSNKIRLGLALKALGYESTNHNNVPFYKVILVKAA